MRGQILDCPADAIIVPFSFHRGNGRVAATRPVFVLYFYITDMEECDVFTTKLRKVGGSVMLAIPPTVLDMLQLQAGKAVGLSVDAGHLVVDPQVRPRYTLDELLAQCDASADTTVEDRAWLDGEPAGGELL